MTAKCRHCGLERKWHSYDGHCLERSHGHGDFVQTGTTYEPAPRRTARKEKR